jgi:Ca2+-binding EF-hand superfamily protein
MFNHPRRLIAATGSALLIAQIGLATAQTPPNSARAEHMRAQWQKADTDKDGQLSKAEVQATGKKHLLEHFDAIDTNKDGKISETEIKAWMQAMRQNRPHDHARAPNGSAPHPAAPHPPGKEGMGFKSPDQRRVAMQERFNNADTNKDGGLSRAELQAAGMHRVLEHFDAIDTNKDGKITADEMRAAWERRK